MTDEQAATPEQPEAKKPWVYTPKTDDELKLLARDINAGRVFTSNHLPEHDQDMLRMIFMMIAFMEPADVDALQANKIAVFYEYLDKAGPRSINGYPSFFSVQTLNVDDAVKCFEYAKKLHEAEQQALNSL